MREGTQGVSSLLMKVLLLKDVKGLGARGEIVEVSEGYAANYLFRRKLAVPANEGIIKEVEKKQKAKVAKEEKKRQEALALKQELDGMILEIAKEAGDSGKLFSAITAKDIASELSQRGFNIEKKQVVLKRPIKTLGDTHVKVKIYKGISSEIIVRAVKK